jgi:membrane-bound serine protease (ClpP class)
MLRFIHPFEGHLLHRSILISEVHQERKFRTITGSEGMVGQRGLAKTNLTPKGTIIIHGEMWDGMSEEPVEAGHPIEVTHIDGLTLYVKPASTKQGGT